MKKSTRSILQEISNYVPIKSRDEIIESRAAHVIASAINLMELISENYSEEEAEMLEKRFLSSIKGRDAARFTRMLKRVVDEDI